MDNKTSGIFYASHTTPEKHSPRKLKWVVVAAAVVATGLVVSAFVFLLRPAHPTLEELRKTFNLYANQLLYGESSEKDLEGQFNPVDLYNTFKVDIILEDDTAHNEVRAYYTKLAELLDNFESKYQKMHARHSNLGEPIKNYRQTFTIFAKYALINDLSEDFLLKKYLADGELATLAYIESAYTATAEDENETVKKYGITKIETASTFVHILNIYQEQGCIKQGSLNEVCAKNLTTDPVIRNYYHTIRENKDATDDMLNFARSDLLSGCWDINDKLKGMAKR
ncbi:MAG: hypothetical protein LBQ02_01890 [Candidatus Nomurabacteria bacterium]|jgi:hypothetical protein|nr:hypothetical protein [Candidatus Nomurabacteria bacterium]